MLIRFIVWLIVGYIIAKILGAVLYTIRKYFSNGEAPKNVYPSAAPKQRYHNVEDVDYEEIEEKKK